MKLRRYKQKGQRSTEACRRKGGSFSVYIQAPEDGSEVKASAKLNRGERVRIMVKVVKYLNAGTSYEVSEGKAWCAGLSKDTKNVKKTVLRSNEITCACQKIYGDNDVMRK